MRRLGQGSRGYGAPILWRHPSAFGVHQSERDLRRYIHPYIDGIAYLCKIDDLAEADDLFTKLMGDVVEPRREFIQTNALNVSNLDF